MINIKMDKRNYRKHNDKNKQLIEKSLKECGAGRSIVIDSENEIIAGNGIYEQAQKLKIPVKIIETNGDELIAVKRMDLTTNDEKRKQLSIMDNSTSDSSQFDIELLKEDFEIKKLKEFGIDIEIEEHKDLIDISHKIEEFYEVVCECADEKEQEKLFYKLTNEGIKCRILTL